MASFTPKRPRWSPNPPLVPGFVPQIPIFPQKLWGAPKPPRLTPKPPPWPHGPGLALGRRGVCGGELVLLVTPPPYWSCWCGCPSPTLPLPRPFLGYFSPFSTRLPHSFLSQQSFEVNSQVFRIGVGETLNFCGENYCKEQKKTKKRENQSAAATPKMAPRCHPQSGGALLKMAAPPSMGLYGEAGRARPPQNGATALPKMAPRRRQNGAGAPPSPSPFPRLNQTLPGGRSRAGAARAAAAPRPGRARAAVTGRGRRKGRGRPRGPPLGPAA